MNNQHNHIMYLNPNENFDMAQRLYMKIPTAVTPIKRYRADTDIFVFWHAWIQCGPVIKRSFFSKIQKTPWWMFYLRRCRDIFSIILIHWSCRIFRCILLNEKFCILFQISPKYVPKSPIDNTSALVQVMAWRRTADKPLPEPMMTQFTDAYMRH